MPAPNIAVRLIQFEPKRFYSMRISGFLKTELKPSGMHSEPQSAQIQSGPKSELIMKKHSSRNKKKRLLGLLILRSDAKMLHAVLKKINLA
jgi:hypothetical protein